MEIAYNGVYDFPKQRVPNSEKRKPEWYANCCDWIIGKAIGLRDTKELYQRYEIMHDRMPGEFYKKILNPYNATNEKYTRFPAEMRNYDLIKGIVRRYISEYNKNEHIFIVGANNPEVVFAKDAKLREEVSILLQNAIAAEIQRSFQEYINQGGDPQQFNPQEQVNIEEFVEKFNEDYIDDISKQGQDILDVIRDITEDTLFYTKLYNDFICFGEAYTYADVVGTKLVKRTVNPIDAFPIPNSEQFVEDYDMFCERRKLSLQQILDEFDEYLTEKDREFLETYYGQGNANGPVELTFGKFCEYYGDVCNKFTHMERNFFNSDPILKRDYNGGLFDVYHVTWRGMERQAIVTYVSQAGLISTRVEDDDYVLNSSTGDISIEYVYVPQVYESVRIGTRNDSIYPYKARAIAYNRNGKLPYNGLMELLPGYGRFSVIDIVTPYQVFYNIVSYAREMAIAKLKLSILLLPKSLLGKNAEDTIYKMLADGVLYVEDKDDQGMLRAQQVRMLNTTLGDYIKQLTDLLSEVKDTANLAADMTPQRYGEIATSAGKGTTQEAIARGSMGTVIVEYMMDCIRERDYARDMDYSKLAWIDGLNTSFRDSNNKLKYISLDVKSHIYADYVIKAKNSIVEKEKLDNLRQLAFNASQNGDIRSAVAAIEGDNIAEVRKLIDKFQTAKEQYELQAKQMDQQLEQMREEFELQKIEAKGNEDRKTLELDGYIKQQIELIRADANMISYDNGVTEEAKQAGMERLEDKRNAVARQKNDLEKQKAILDTYNKERDREVKMHDIDTQLKIAKENKNRYDK